MCYAHPGNEGAIISFEAHYGNYIGSEFMPPVKGQYFTNISPVDGQLIAEFPYSTARDIDKALDAARTAVGAWGRASVQERSSILLKIADRIGQNLELFAVIETWNNGRATRGTLSADILLAADHLRYFADCIRAQGGSTAGISDSIAAYRIHEPLDVVGQIIPWNFSLLMVAQKLVLALAAGDCVVLEPTEQTPLDIYVLLKLISNLLPSGVLNIVQGFGREADEALATSKHIAKVVFTGSTPVGSHVLKCITENIILSTVELGDKSPSICFEGIMQTEPASVEEAAEGLVLAFFNQGEVCAYPSRTLVQESVYPAFMEGVLKKIRAIRRGDPLNIETIIGAQASQQQCEKILSYFDIAQQGGAEVLTGGSVEELESSLTSGYYVQPTLPKGHDEMHMFQKEVFGLVIGVITFKDGAEALTIASNTGYGLGANLWTCGIDHAYRMSHEVEASYVQANCYRLYPAHAAFGGYKKSDVGRGIHKTTLDRCQQTKSLLVNYDINPLGSFQQDPGPAATAFFQSGRAGPWNTPPRLTVAPPPPPRQVDCRAVGIVTTCVHHVQHTTGKTGIDSSKIEVENPCPSNKSAIRP